MDIDRARTFLLALPHAVETEQFGGLLYWVADKAIGGRMFTMLNLSARRQPIWFACGRERYNELLEREGLLPAPYLARAFWVAAEHWTTLRTPAWDAEPRAAHAIASAPLPARTHKLLQLPKSELKQHIAERRKLLAARGK